MNLGSLDGAARLIGVSGTPANVTSIAGTGDDNWGFAMGGEVSGVRGCSRAQVPRSKDGAAIVDAVSTSGASWTRQSALRAVHRNIQLQG
jgi:hypothetical protein